MSSHNPSLPVLSNPLLALADTARLASLAMLACAEAPRPAAREPHAADLMALAQHAAAAAHTCLDRWPLAVDLADIPALLFDAAGLLHTHPHPAAPRGVLDLAHQVADAAEHLSTLMCCVSSQVTDGATDALGAVAAARRHSRRLFDLHVEEVRCLDGDPETTARVVEMMELLRHACDVAGQCAGASAVCVRALSPQANAPGGLHAAQAGVG